MSILAAVERGLILPVAQKVADILIPDHEVILEPAMVRIEQTLVDAQKTLLDVQSQLEPSGNIYTNPALPYHPSEVSMQLQQRAKVIAPVSLRPGQPRPQATLRPGTPAPY